MLPPVALAYASASARTAGCNSKPGGWATRTSQPAAAAVSRNELGTAFGSGLMCGAHVSVTGSFFVEEAFAIPGASSFFIEGARTRDFPLLLGMTVALAVVVLLANALADILLAVVDPRIREETTR